MTDLTYISSVAGYENEEDFLKECQGKVRAYVRRHYGSHGNFVEDIEQSVMEKLLVKDFPTYDKKKEADVWKFIMARVVYNASNAFLDLSGSFGCSGDTLRKAKKAKKLIESGHTEEEVMEILGIGKNTLSSYLTASQSVSSMDAENPSGGSLYNITGKEDECEKEEVTDDNEMLDGLTSEQKFIISEYLKCVKRGSKAWKRDTIAACQERGISKKRVNEVVDAFRNGEIGGQKEEI